MDPAELIPGFRPETELEERLTSDPELLAGLAWGEPRTGHPEGAVGTHVSQLLEKLDRSGETGERREILRAVTLVHDAFKSQVRERLPRIERPRLLPQSGRRPVAPRPQHDLVAPARRVLGGGEHQPAFLQLEARRRAPLQSQRPLALDLGEQLPRTSPAISPTSDRGPPAGVSVRTPSRRSSSSASCAVRSKDRIVADREARRIGLRRQRARCICGASEVPR